MYTEVERRTINHATIQDTIERAQKEFFPKLEHAPGLIGFYLVSDEENSINTAILIWESKAQADIFEEANGSWRQTLDQLGHMVQSDNRGETVIRIEPKP
jgi:hypothetical protein